MQANPIRTWCLVRRTAMQMQMEWDCNAFKYGMSYYNSMGWFNYGNVIK